MELDVSWVPRWHEQPKQAERPITAWALCLNFPRFHDSLMKLVCATSDFIKQKFPIKNK